MFYISCFLILSGNMTLCAENKTTHAETNKIHRGNVKTEHHNRTEEQRLDKRHIDEDSFKAYMCNEGSDLSTAEFSLNDPPNCNREDGSAYYTPVAKKTQILQRLRRIPVEVTVWQVDLRILVGWCGGEYVALNYMHRNIETKRTTVQPTNVQCHHSSPNDPLEIELPEYGTINGIQLMMHLTGGVGEASFQPGGFSRPNSDFEGSPFTPPANDQSRITYIDYRRHLEKKAQWSTHEIQRAVVTYQLSVKVMKKIGYIVNGGKRLNIPDMLTINRTTTKLKLLDSFLQEV